MSSCALPKSSMQPDDPARIVRRDNGQQDTLAIHLGFDPGGDSKFGVAIVDGHCVRTSTVSSVDDAIGWATDQCGSSRPVAAGIDTLLHWVTSRSGMRPCDLRLRATYRPMKNSIMSPNSLYGAMAIGGMALAIRLRQVWPEIILNETHPKVLLHALWGQRYDPKDRATVEAVVQFFVNESPYTEANIAGEHALDAALSAWATQKGLMEGWTDIVGATGTLLFPAGEARYLWPESIRSHNLTRHDAS